VSRHHVTARIPEDLYDAIEEIREAERLDRSAAIARLLERGVEDWRLERAVEQYRDGDLSLGRAAELAEVSLWQFLDELEERSVPVNYSEGDLEADIAALDER